MDGKHLSELARAVKQPTHVLIYGRKYKSCCIQSIVETLARLACQQTSNRKKMKGFNEVIAKLCLQKHNWGEHYSTLKFQKGHQNFVDEVVTRAFGVQPQNFFQGSEWKQQQAKRTFSLALWGLANSIICAFPNQFLYCSVSILILLSYF